jgi:hypothetical protein
LFHATTLIAFLQASTFINSFFVCFLLHSKSLTMDDRLSKSKRKLAKSAQPSLEEKEAMTGTLEKARLKEVRPAAQPTPLEPPSFEPPVESLGTAAPPPTDFPDAAAAQVNYNYGGRYGGVQPTRFNSTAVDDQENDARAKYIYQQGRHIRSAILSAPGYLAYYSAPYYEPNAYGQGHRASSAAPPRENPLPALDRMQLILEGIERATNASSLAIQLFVGQGELYRFR